MGHLLHQLNNKFSLLFFLLVSMIVFVIAIKLGDESTEGQDVSNISLTHRSEEIANLSRSPRSSSQRDKLSGSEREQGGNFDELAGIAGKEELTPEERQRVLNFIRSAPLEEVDRLLREAAVNDFYETILGIVARRMVDDPAAAYHWLSTLPPEDYNKDAFVIVGKTCGHEGFGLSDGLSSFKNPVLKAKFVEGYFAGAGEVDPINAYGKLKEVEPDVDSEVAFFSLLKGAGRRPGEGIENQLKIFSEEGAIDLLNDSLLRSVAQDLARADVEAFRDWIVVNSDLKSVVSLASVLGREWAQNSPDTAFDWVSDPQLEAPVRNQTLVGFAEGLATRSPEMGIKALRMIDNEAIRNSAVDRFFNLITNPERAHSLRRLLEEGTVPE